MERASGILLHITSLPARYGIGDLGPWAYRFAGYLAQAGQSYWQVLPVTPPASMDLQCPYGGSSAFAGNTMLISPEQLYRQGYLARKDISPHPDFSTDHVDFKKVTKYKNKLFDIAYENFKAAPQDDKYKRFCKSNQKWLDDHAMFTALKGHFGSGRWHTWPDRLRDRGPDAIKYIKQQLTDPINKEKFLQYQFFKQWHNLKDYCNRYGVKLIGDIPIYIAYDSADVWAHPRFFKLTSKKKPRVISGVPPDDFNKTGQLWGNPVYDWDNLKEHSYSWWINRFMHNFELFDMVRVDHFRGFVAGWEVPSWHHTAEKGKWVDAPANDFLQKLFKKIDPGLLIVEDLGNITQDVVEVVDKFGLAGMKILMWAFGGKTKENLHNTVNYVKNSVVYTGTHDNNTIRGWFNRELKEQQKKELFEFLGKTVPPKQIHWELIRLAFASVSGLAIIPLQDVLGLGEIARMNRPGTVRGNWTWRLRRGQITPVALQKLKHLTTIYARS